MAIETLKNNKLSIIILVVSLVATICFPFLTESRYLNRVVIDILFFTAMGNAWNIIGGYGRQTSWASSTFFAIGAYTSIMLFLHFQISPFISMWLGMALAVFMAVIIGLPCFRLRGVYFAIATIAMMTIFMQLLIYFSDFTGGNLGLSIPIIGPANPLYGPFNLIFSDFTLRPYYFIALAWMVVTVAIVWVIERRQLGYHLRAICEDQDAAESLGINSAKVKLQAFVISAMMLSFTGTLYVFMLRMVDPVTFASMQMSVRIAIVAILGGMGTKFGPLVGALITIPLFEISNNYLARFGHGGAGWVLYGLLIVVMVLFRPNGIVSLFDNAKNLITRSADKGKAGGEAGGV